jgi:sugar lactone lactonase YvrE
MDHSGNMYVPDTGNHCIRKITQNGLVTTIAGVPGVSGNQDGPSSHAKFNHPQGIAIDSFGALYISDTDNNSIRKITSDGIVSTIYPNALNTDTLNSPTGIDVDSDGTIYIADTSNNVIRILLTNGEMNIMSGFRTPGYLNSINDATRFYYPTGVKIHIDGSLLVTDQYNNVVRKIALGENNKLLIDTHITNKGVTDYSFNYADVALTPVYSDNHSATVSVQNLNISRSTGIVGQLGPTLSRGPGTMPPFIQGHQRGSRK